MGVRGPLPKKPGRVLGHRQPAQVVRLVPGVGQKVPAVPHGLLPSVRRRWRTFWLSPKSQLVTPENRPALERLFRLYNDLEVEGEEFRRHRLVKGSVGQVRISPLADHLLKLEEKILRLEVEFGLTPLAASRLGLVYGEASRSLDDLNRRLREPHSDNGATEDDPYAALLQSSADQGRPEAPEPRS
jgi:hypothetical protein